MHDDNPYRSPRSDCGRGTFGARWRRAVAAYRESLRRENISGWEHVQAWLTVPIFLMFAMFILYMNLVVLR